MNNLVSEWAESHFPLYTAVGIHSLYTTSNLPIFKIQESHTVLLIIAGGKGILRINDQTWELSEGNVVLLPAHGQAALITNPLHPLHAYKLTIGIREPMQPAQAGVIVRSSEVVFSASFQLLANEPSMVSQVEELYLHRSPADEARHVENQILFHQILLQLLKKRDAKYAASEQPSMERSITYLENHFVHKITREQLAEMAGITPSHYSILFKQLKGFSPKEYLSRLRVHRAIELMIGGSLTLREIALQVGYKDEFYLSRRFKQQTGAAPSAYNRLSPQRVAVLLTPYASHLLLLGVEPAVTISDNSEYVNIPDIQLPSTMKFVNTDSSAQQVKSVLLENRIELILAAKQHLHQYGLNHMQLRAVAPVIEIEWMEMGWKEHLRLIARAVQQSERAERWLADFEQEERSARLQLQQSSGEAAKEVVTILVLRPEELLVYGARNVGYVIYQSLGLRPPPKIEREMQEKKDQFHSIPIGLPELADYAGDRLLVIVFPDEKGSTAHAESIFQSAEWNKLSAVRNNRVHHLEEEAWIPYNPVSIRLQLQRAVGLWTDHQ
ncbi:helix-turn-helix domain-containing protein [Paenibacillus filicis]|uniref:Helix-turn-helix domain-containing protein n=1 Tax=Paenibacillus filicis TaxID=669464 RepID=A0ABU9DHA0_9BACL